MDVDNTTYLKGLREKDPAVLQAIYKNFALRIEHHIVANGGSSEDAKDVFQDALMVLYDKAKQEDFTLTSQFYTYLHSVVYYIWDRKRKKKGHNTVTIPEDGRLIFIDNIEQDILQRERHNVFRQNLMKLGTVCQQLLQYFFENKSMAEIAHLMGLKNEHTARNRKYRCQKKLEVLVQADERYEELKNSPSKLQ